jgi:hypothetical protein
LAKDHVIDQEFIQTDRVFKKFKFLFFVKI